MVKQTKRLKILRMPSLPVWLHASGKTQCARILGYDNGHCGKHIVRFNADDHPRIRSQFRNDVEEVGVDIACYSSSVLAVVKAGRVGDAEGCTRCHCVCGCKVGGIDPVDVKPVLCGFSNATDGMLLIG